jgi:hypothetical protein
MFIQLKQHTTWGVYRDVVVHRCHVQSLSTWYCNTNLHTNRSGSIKEQMRTYHHRLPVECTLGLRYSTLGRYDDYMSCIFIIPIHATGTYGSKHATRWYMIRHLSPVILCYNCPDKCCTTVAECDMCMTILYHNYTTWYLVLEYWYLHPR